MWNAYEKYDPDKGSMATYFNFTIRNRLIDTTRNITSENNPLPSYIAILKNNGATSQHATLNELLLDNHPLWQKLKPQLTSNQWKWIQHKVIDNMPLKDIAIQENITVEPVKSWGKQVRKKIQNEPLRSILLQELYN